MLLLGPGKQHLAVGGAWGRFGVVPLRTLLGSRRLPCRRHTQGYTTAAGGAAVLRHQQKLHQSHTGQGRAADRTCAPSTSRCHSGFLLLLSSCVSYNRGLALVATSSQLPPVRPAR